MKEFVERGLDKSGIKLIGTGDVTDDDLLADIGDSALGAVTTHHYSADHDSPENKAFVAAFEKANSGMRPNFMAVGAYDGMALVYQALEKTKGDASGDALIAAMKGMSWMSPRGPVSIDPETRDIVQNIYVRKVEKKDGAALQRRVRDHPQREGPLQGREKIAARERAVADASEGPLLPRGEGGAERRMRAWRSQISLGELGALVFGRRCNASALIRPANSPSGRTGVVRTPYGRPPSPRGRRERRC